MTGPDKEDVIDLGTCTAENMKKILPNLTPEALAGHPIDVDPNEDDSLAARLKSACAND